MSDATTTSARPRVVIVGGGFGGLACAQALAGSDVETILVDQHNHHLFQPLLYQAATAALSPADITTPLRHILAQAKNITVLMAKVTGVDPAAKTVRLETGDPLAYDRLVLATGAVYSYFGHPEWEAKAPAPKSIHSVREIRSRLLTAFEDAERAKDEEARRGLLTFVVVGGGPTGVETAGAIAELARWTLKGDFRRFDPAKARVILMEGGPRLLAAFPDSLGDYAQAALEALGVEVRLGHDVEAIDDRGVTLNGERIPAATVVWGAGTRAAEGAAWVGGSQDKAGRIAIAPDLSVPGCDGIYALGDLALLKQDGAPLPGLAQVAAQQGAHLGRALRTGAPPTPFRYRSKGDTAVIGRRAAVFTLGRLRLKGRPAWLLWAIVHVYLLIGFQQRSVVMLQWIWRYFTAERGARLID